MEMIKRLVREEEGQGMVEYVLIIAVIALVVVVAMPFLTNAIAGAFNDAAAKM